MISASQKASAFGGTGVAYVFERQQDETWKELAKLTDFEGTFSQVGQSVALSDAYAAITNIGSGMYGSNLLVVANLSSVTTV